MNPLIAKLTRGRHGSRAEKQLAKRMNDRSKRWVRMAAELTPGSGNLQGAKGDIRTRTVLLESKSTVNDSLSLKYAWLIKISKEALDCQIEPALCVQFVNALGEARRDGSWVMIREAYFDELTEEISR